MHLLRLFDRRTILRARRLWLHYGVFWLGAIATGLVAVLYARLIDVGYGLFLRLESRYFWLPLFITPAIAALAVWLTRRFFPGAEGSGIPQVIATLHDGREAASRLLSLRVLVGKVVVSFFSILGGFTIGREGPTIHVGAALMFSLRRFYPRRLRRLGGAAFERNLALAGAAAGLSAAFNAPLAGVVFAIEELTRSFEARTSGVLITAIIFAGVVSLALQGNYTYFGTINIDGHFPDLLALVVVLLGVITGIAGGVFCWLLLNTHRWMPRRLVEWRKAHPVMFGGACGLMIALIGLVAGGHTFGSGYVEARGMLEGTSQLGVSYPVLKMASMIWSYLPGAPGGLFAPSLAIGAGVGNALHLVFAHVQLPMLIALGMVGYLAAVTQSPITAFVIVIEMINGHTLVLSLMSTALIASRVSRLFAPPLYEALARRYDSTKAAQ
ncbi:MULTISPECIES: chloride channel protein [unclassified Caballeronia]|uniref:chloride channel protein n=1 Tax=unclassified Caballeronia TaxID=2646786 RepID=UPI0028656F0F|nr:MULTISPECIES: chloride channel protein [unclassified Caballeronia]MDR5777075.1 chloride channel protein [Caballeronia sp. LZ002]MDR5798628.1 chloride channel protein [Caballeronia sp. LZ001]MDR5852481.1 chloride channel protein [Caballeronia sp. LZ003]